jgi:hypothetical protein
MQQAVMLVENDWWFRRSWLTSSTNILRYIGRATSPFYQQGLVRLFLWRGWAPYPIYPYIDSAQTLGEEWYPRADETNPTLETSNPRIVGIVCTTTRFKRSVPALLHWHLPWLPGSLSAGCAFFSQWPSWWHFGWLSMHKFRPVAVDTAGFDWKP